MLQARFGLCCALLAVASACTRQEPGPQVQPSRDPGRNGAPVLGSVTPVSSPAAAGARFPHLAQADDGSLLLSWLQPAGAGGTFSLQFARWQATPRAWDPPRTVAQGNDWFINWADFPSVVPFGQGHLVAHWLQQRPGNVYAYDVRLAASRDDGATWSAPWSPHDDGTPTEHGFVTVDAMPDGQPYVVWLDGRNTMPAETGGEHAGHGAEGSGAMTLRGAIVAQDGAAASSAEIDA